MSTNWYIRKTGANANGGTSTAVRSTGTDGIVNTTAGLTKVTSITATWTAADIGHGINVAAKPRLITAVTLGTTLAVVTTSGSTSVASVALFTSGMVGQAITGPGIPANTVITVFTTSSLITISNAAGAGFGAGTATLYPMATTSGATAMVAGTAQTWNVGGSWLTVGLATGTTSPVVSGDTIYVGAGVYREAPTLSLAPTSTTSFIADVDGTNTGDAGEVVITAYTTNDKTAPTTTIFNNTAPVNFYSWQGFTLVGGTLNLGSVYADPTSVSGGHDWTWKDCTFIASAGGSDTILSLFVSATQAPNLTVDRCRFMARARNANAGVIQVTATKPLSADLNLNILIQNSLFVSGAVGVYLASTGANTFKPGGVTVQGCTLVGMSIGMKIADVGWSTSIPAAVNNSYINAGAGLTASTSGQIIESYNFILSSVPRTAVSAGTGSISDGSYAPMLSVGQEYYWGGPPVQPFSPTNTPNQLSPLAGFGSGASPSAYDLNNRPRPSGAASLSISAGALEVHDFATKEVSVVDATVDSMKLTGPGDQEIIVPVDAVAATISIRSRHDANHGDTNKPQALLLSNGEIGVAAQTITATQTSGNWETLTFAQITPTAKGWVTLRLLSRSAAASGIAYFDTLAVV